ncbi:MAG: ThiF family adenylyltransferase, partial [Alkalispirochaeta sp.]
VGRLTLFDGDVVAYHNLHRQTLFSREDVGRPKAEAVAQVLQKEYPELKLTAVARYFAAGSAAPAAPDAPNTLAPDDPPDLLLDCTDRFSSRFAVHDAGHRLGVDVISAAVAGFTGQLHIYPFSLNRTPCLRCLYPEVLTDGCTGSCAVDGILGAAAGTMGAWQALTALRTLLGEPAVSSATTHTIELTTMEVMTTAWDRDPHCPLCGDHDEDRSSTSAPGARKIATETRAAKTTGSAATTSPAEEEPQRQLRRSTRTPTRTIDLREAHEIMPLDRTLLPGAEHRPLDHLLSSVDELDRSHSYLLVCEHGVRSAMARDVMVQAGFSEVTHIAGGYAALRALIE